jgi:hypothetical protein
MSFEQQPRAERKPIQDPEIVKIMDNIDFKGLRAIFEEHASRSGIEPSSIGFVEKDRISESDWVKVLSGAVAAHSATEQRIEISSKIIRAKTFLDQDTDKAAVVLSSLCHEEAHASSHHRYESHEKDALMGLVTKKFETITSGFSQKTLVTPEILDEGSDSKFTWFNEGMTDEFASTVYEEYLQRHPTQPQDAEKDMTYNQGYPLARIFIRTLRDRLAEESGVPSDVVWEALVRTYMRGDDYAKGEIREVLDEVFSDRFVSQLAYVGESSNILNLVPIIKNVYGAANVGHLFAQVISPTIAKNMLKELGNELRERAQAVTNKIARA